MQNLLLSHHLAVGDVVVATAVVRDLVKTYPGQFRVAFDTNMSPVFDNNPYVVPKETIQKERNWQYVRLDYAPGLYDQRFRGCHFMEYFHKDLASKTGIEVPLTLPYPDLHLTDEEKEVREYQERYWVIFAGGKNDFPIKIWNWKHAQEVVNQIRGMGLQVVQSGGRGQRPVHVHYPLENCIHDLDRADLRQLFRLIYHAEGVICGITGPMHIAAALQRPCVVVAGGREAWWWEAYVHENPGFRPHVARHLLMPHKYLHTIGLMDCCQNHGCWLNKVVQIDNDKLLCKRPVVHEHQAVAGCLEIIRPEHVMEAVSYYYTSKLLPPIVPTTPIPPRLQVAPQMLSQPTETAPAAVEESNPFDHPAVGGRFTICMVMYGSDYFEMQKKALTSILSTIPAKHRQIRIGTNALGPQCLNWLRSLQASGDVQVLIVHEENHFKYPVMRELFNHEAPLDQWVLWFDDDTIADLNPNWAYDFAKAIPELPARCGAAGRVLYSRLSPTQRAYYATRPWWRGRQLQLPSRGESVNGENVFFLHGGWWAMRTSVIRELDIPDPQLKNNGGDICIGEMLHQNSYAIAHLTDLVRISSAPRRGESQPHFGSEAWQIRFLGEQKVFAPEDLVIPAVTKL